MSRHEFSPGRTVYRGEEDEMSEEQVPVPPLDPDERDLEAPVPDAFEQTLSVDPSETPEPVRVPPDVNEADALEQAQIVETDEDDYR